MDPKRPTPADSLVVPTDRSSIALRLPADEPADEDLPPPYVDARLVEPETRQEMFRGRQLVAVPANPEHGDEHTALDYVARGDLAPGYVASTDLLTRAGQDCDFATDTCIRREGIDPRTGSRYLEEVAFEVVNTQSFANMTERARQLTTCGVRRVFAVFVESQKVGEWSAEQDRFTMLDLDAAIEDRTLVGPLPVRALFDAAEADNSVARALAAKGNPVFAEVRAEGHAEGRAAGLVEAIELVCTQLAISLSSKERATMKAMDAQELLSLLSALQTERRWPDC